MPSASSPIIAAAVLPEARRDDGVIMSVPVIDPTGARDDAAMPAMRRALQPEYMARRLASHLSSRLQLGAGPGTLELRAVRVGRHKPGRRSLVEYELSHPAPDGGEMHATVLGKLRATGVDRRSFETQNALWHHGFGPGNDDRIGVPEPLGVLPDLGMWLQRKVTGVPAMERLTGPHRCDVAGRIAAAIHKLQRSCVLPKRRHTLIDELAILHQRLPAVAEALPVAWAARIGRVLQATDRLAASMSRGGPRPSHRDFYADNVIVDDHWLHLVDLDLYCEADPELDIGNFIAHVTEYSLRTHADPAALADVEQALEEAFVARAGEASRAAVRAYATLTLVRHIAISRQIPERRFTTPALIELCEQRLGIATR